MNNNTAPQTNQQQPYIPVQNVTNPSQLSPIIGRLNKHDGEIRRQKKVVDWTLALTIGISIVSFIAFTTLMIDAWKYHAEKYEENTKVIESLKEENRKLKEKPLQEQLDALQQELKVLKQNQTASPSAVSN